MVECRGEEFVPVEDAAEEFPDVDEVKVVPWVCPVEVEIFDFEGAVWGYEEGLDGREVGADYVGRGVGVGHFATGVSRNSAEIFERKVTLPKFPSRFRGRGYYVGCLEVRGGVCLRGS